MKILNFTEEEIDVTRCVITYEKFADKLDICEEAKEFWENELNSKDLDIDRYISYFWKFDVAGFLLKHLKMEINAMYTYKTIFVKGTSENYEPQNNHFIKIDQELYNKIHELHPYWQISIDHCSLSGNGASLSRTLNEPVLSAKDKLFLRRCLKAFVMTIGKKSDC